MATATRPTNRAGSAVSLDGRRNGSGPSASPRREVPAERRPGPRGPAPIPVELAAALLVPAAAVSFTRVFDRPGAVVPIVGAALLSTALAALLRRLRVPLVASAAISALVLLFLVVNRFAPGTGRLGFIPTGATRDALRALVDELVRNFQELRTPVPALDPFMAAAMIGAWLMAFLTDWGALRLRLAFEPVLPAGLLFVFAAVLGAGTNPVPVTVLFGLAIGLWGVVQRAANLADGNNWLADDRRRGSLGVAGWAGLFALVAVGLGAVAGPRLPGADAEEMLSLRDAGDPTRVVVSPYVSIQSQLVQQTNTPLFTVSATEPSYWRLAGLDTYEQNIWKVAGNFSPQDGELPGQPTLAGQRDRLEQRYTISNLNSIWLPAAFSPTEIHDATAKATWNAETSSLTVANDVESSNGVSYTAVSQVPRLTPEELRAAPETIPQDIADRYLALPDVPQVARTTAAEVTAGAATRYDKMLALQSFFRGFDYSVDLPPRQGDPIQQFLSERVGFCQQFAGTFAVMARTLNIPARVAIGFTWGDPIGDPVEGVQTYQVTGRQTHAWPEVWFEGLGWVAFEPTPGRGAPSSAAYTQVAAQQDSAIQQTPGAPVSTTTTAALGSGAGAPVVGEPEIPLDSGDIGTAADSDQGVSTGTIIRFLIAVAVLGAYAGGVPLWHRLRRQRRRQQVRTPADGVETSWAEATETLSLMYGIARRPAETRREFAQRLGSDPRVPRQAMGALAEKATVARYYPQGLRADDAGEASALAAEIEQAVASRVSAYTRWKRLVDPRRLLKGMRRSAGPRGRSGPGAGPSSGAPSSNGNGYHPEATHREPAGV